MQSYTICPEKFTFWAWSDNLSNSVLKLQCVTMKLTKFSGCRFFVLFFLVKDVDA